MNLISQLKCSPHDIGNNGTTLDEIKCLYANSKDYREANCKYAYGCQYCNRMYYEIGVIDFEMEITTRIGDIDVVSYAYMCKNCHAEKCPNHEESHVKVDNSNLILSPYPIDNSTKL